MSKPRPLVFTPSSFLPSSGHIYIFPGALVTTDPGERTGGSSMGHNAGLDPYPLIRFSASHLGHLRPGHYPGNPDTGDTMCFSCCWMWNCLVPLMTLIHSQLTATFLSHSASKSCAAPLKPRHWPSTTSPTSQRSPPAPVCLSLRSQRHR